MKLRGFFVLGGWLITKMSLRLQLRIAKMLENWRVAVWQNIVIALALVMIAEGILPFLSPKTWRKLALNIARQDDHAMRIMGLISMVAGLVTLYWVNG